MSPTHYTRKSLFLPAETNSERRLRREASKWLDTLEQPRELSFFERLADVVDIATAPFVPTEPRGFGKTGGDFLGFIPGTLTPRFSKETTTLAPRTFFGRDPLTPAQRRAAIESELQASLLPGGPKFEQVEIPGKFSLRERVEAFQELPLQTQLVSGLLFDLPFIGPTDIALRGLSAGARGAGRFARTGRAADIFGSRGVRELEDISRLPATAAEKQAKARRALGLRAAADAAAAGEPSGWKSRVPAGAADGPAPTLPSGLTRATPKYGKINLTFVDDLDRASYIIARADKKSQSDAAYLKFVQDNTGLNVTAARARGAEVRARIKELARAAGPDVDTLTVERTAAAADVPPAARVGEDTFQPSATQEQIDNSLLRFPGTESLSGMVSTDPNFVVTRYASHIPPGSIGPTKEGGIQAYNISGSPSEIASVSDKFKAGKDQKVVWLQSPANPNDPYVVDLSRLNPANVGAEASGYINAGDIPPSALVRTPTDVPVTPAARGGAAEEVPIREFNMSPTFATDRESRVLSLGSDDPITKRGIKVRSNDYHLLSDIASDAEHWADMEGRWRGEGYEGLAKSAKSTLRNMRKAGIIDENNHLITPTGQVWADPLRAADVPTPVTPAARSYVLASRTSLPEDMSRTVFHGTRSDDIGSFIREDGSLVLRSSENFEGRQVGVSLSPSQDVARDYASRTGGRAGPVRSRAQGMVFEIDSDALPLNRLSRQAADEFFVSGADDVVIPRGKFRVVSDPEAGAARTALTKWETRQVARVKALSNSELGREEAARLNALEIAETEMLPKGRPTPGLNEDIVAKYGDSMPDSFPVEAEILSRVRAAPDPERVIAEIVSDVPSTGAPIDAQYLAGELRKELPTPAAPAARVGDVPEFTPVQMGFEELLATQRVLPSETAVISPVGGGPPTPPPGGGKFPPDEPPMQPPAESGNMALGDLRDLPDVMDEVVTLDIDNAAIRILSNVTGINPSVLRNTTIGRAATAFARQLIAADSLADVAIAAMLKTQLRGAAEKLPMRITADGLYEDTGVPWNQVFANPSKYDLSDAELAFITPYNRLPVELKNLRAAHGLPDLGTVADEFYVPRQVVEIRDIPLSKRSSPKYRRFYEDAEVGFAKGIKYHADPIATMRLHITSTYREIALKQLDDVVSQFAIKPRQLISKKIADSANEAAVVLRNAKRDLRNAIRAANGEELVERIGKEQATAQEEAGLAPAVSKVQQKLRRARAKRRKELEQAVSDARENLETATRDFNVERAKYKAALVEARNSEVAPGYLWHNDAPTIAVGEWHNNFFPLEDANLLNEAAGRLQRGDPSSAWKAFEKTANTIRFLASVGDFAAPFIQGLPILARNPEAWGRATLAHYQAWFDVGVQSRYIRDNIEVFKEMGAHGIPIGDVEFFRALQPGGGFSAGSLIERLPHGAATREILNAMGRQSFGRFQSSYNTFLTMGRGELWKSMKPTFRGSDAELAAVIRNMTGGLDARALGVGPSRRSAEGMWLAFSPRLLRSTISMVADLRHGTTTARGVEAWRTIGSLVGGATSLYIITGVALGKSEEEIGRGLNPLSGKHFLSHEINGDLVGIGGQIRAITQLGAGISAAIVPGGKPITDLIQFNRWENPMMQFWMFRGAPALNIALGTMEATSGANIDPFRNIQSTPDLLYHIGFSALPFSLQGALEGEKPITTALALAGMRTSVLREQGGASFTGLPRPSTLRPGVSTGVRGSIPTAPVNRLMQPESSGQRPTVPASRLMQPGS